MVVKKRNNADEWTDMLDPIEFEEMKDEMNQFLVNYPNEDQIDATIDTLRQYVPDKRKSYQNSLERLWILIKHAGRELSFIHKSYWVVTILLFMIGYLITSYGAYNPLLTLVFIAPIPFIFGLIEVFKGREQGLLEMEMACKFSAHEVILSRLFLISVFTIVLNTVLMISLTPLMDTRSMMEALLIWFTPFTLFIALSLWLSMKFRGTVLITTLSLLWVVFCASIASHPIREGFLLNMHIVLHLLLIGVGINIFAFQVKQLAKKYSSYEEVGTIEVSY